MEIFDFDRCTGLFSNPVHIPIVATGGACGVAFSPNSRFVYVSSSPYVYQFDAAAADLAASQVLTATWDGFYSPFPPFATLFGLAQLAPDGKIYIGTGNSTLHLHVINNPDGPGLACNLVQHGVELPHFYVNSLPNHPNYHLGPVDGSVCDSLGINVGVGNTGPSAPLRATVQPNPTTGSFRLNYPANDQVGWLEVRNLAGQEVQRERIPQWSTVHQVALEGEAAGMYQCSLRWGMEAMTTRVILAER